jgi:oxalate decarboxylase
MTHIFHLDRQKPQQKNAFGSRSDANKKSFKVLEGISLSLLRLEEKGFREPHWHPNAHELQYCLEGKALVTVFSPRNTHDTFIMEPGCIAFIPMGSIHHVENVGTSALKMLIAFNHESPEDLNLSSSLAAMPASILGTTFKESPNFFTHLHAKEKPLFISQKKNSTEIKSCFYTNPLKMNLEAIQAQIDVKGGNVKISNSFLLPALEGISVYGVTLNDKGAREPHWHPNAHELNYLISGKARITLLSPPHEVETFDMVPGDISFLPKGYLHYIESIGIEPAKFAIFFNHDTPSDIGISGAMSAYSNELLSSLFNTPENYFDTMTRYQEDLFII